MVRCNLCGTANDVFAVYCDACGSSLVSSSRQRLDLCPGDVSDESWAGRCVGGFVLARHVSNDAFGSVWLGRQRDTGVLADVVLRGVPEGADDLNLAEFHGACSRAARALASLDHPHVVRLLAAGTLEPERVAWLALEHVPGGTLADEMARRRDADVPWSVASILELMRPCWRRWRRCTTARCCTWT